MKTRDRRERSVVQVALDVHMTTMGSYERSGLEEEEDIEFLVQRLKEWENTSFARSRYFDLAVKNLIVTTLKEVEIKQTVDNERRRNEMFPSCHSIGFME